MLGHITAARFDRRMESGKSWPCLLACTRSDDDGQDVEVVAKFSDACERKIGGLVVEAIAAMLAADLDLPVPEPLLVDFDSDFVDLIRSRNATLGERVARSVPVTFGPSRLPPGSALLPPGKRIPQGLRAQAAEILAFDALIQNPDRRVENPNCLSDGRDLAIFDHELAFFTRGVIGWTPPWQPGSLGAMIGGASEHAFFQELKGKPVDLSRLMGAWRSISDARLDEYRLALPPVWAEDDGVSEEALKYVAEVRAHIDLATTEVIRILS